MLSKCCNEMYGKKVLECSDEEIFTALLKIVRDELINAKRPSGKKKLYYISAEFLIGKLLINNMINLGIFDSLKKELEGFNKNIYDFEELELEPSLGNGGLGRLASCFLDSIASLGLNGEGIGLNYHFGLFKQEFRDNSQMEEINPWMNGENFLRETDIGYQIAFYTEVVRSKMYDIDISGMDNRVTKLHLFDLVTVDESMVKEGIEFDKTDVEKNLTLFLYPDDSDEDGKKLRLFQQYFMVCNAAHFIIDEAKSRGSNIMDLPDYAVIQINDTHPSLIIPELIRQIMAEGIHMDEAINIVKKCCAYTNHTILAEALEKWPLFELQSVIPNIVPIIEELDRRIRTHVKDTSTYIIDDENLVHMANMDIHYGFSVNGVARLHTEILKNTELKNFYKLYPEKFNNKTNGITFRRWLNKCNEGLSDYISSLIGDEFKKDPMKLRDLLEFYEDETVINKLLEIKAENKKKFCEYIEDTMNISINKDSIFDVQIKRLHEYKRQQMNVLYIIHKYQEIKKGKKPKTPITFIFGAKAAPAYVIAKDIIHLILCLQEIINNDPETSPYIKILMVENYNVSLAEKIIPACDVSEQISLASKEASGTGNMKLMANGAITLGTRDGANIEIAELVGEDNIYSFGKSSNKVIKHYKKADYKASDYYIDDSSIKEIIDFIISVPMLKAGNVESLLRIHSELIKKDYFMTLLDFKEYIKVKDKVFSDYNKKMEWGRKMLNNIAMSGYFSSDRVIKEYNEDIWRI